MAFLGVHGLLHLLGYDHSADEQAQVMEQETKTDPRSGGIRWKENHMSEQIIRSGFVSLIGRPNVGKSTLLNKLVGVRLAITSPKPQTTRQVVRGIIDDENSQIIFLDTPGFHAPRTRLGEYMVQAATTALADGDIALLLVDAEKATGERAYPGIPSIEADIMQKADNMNKKVILVLNKVDRVVKEALLPLMALYASAFDFAAIVPISAKTGDGLDRLISEIRQLLPKGPRYYPVDSLTDQTERRSVRRS